MAGTPGLRWSRRAGPSETSVSVMEQLGTRPPEGARGCETGGSVEADVRVSVWNVSAFHLTPMDAVSRGNSYKRRAG